MQFDSLPDSKVLLFELELGRQVEQTKLLFLLRDHFIEKREVVAKKNNARSIVDLRVFADIALKKDSRHRRDVLMAEAQVGLGESSVPGFHESNANATGFVDHVPRKDFLG